jgi:flagellar basal-body rod protein FlgB
MNMPDIPLLNVLRERMSWLNARQSVLSQNVANADSPGYDARDLKPLDFEQLLKHGLQGSAAGGHLALTDSRHLAPPPDAVPDYEDTPSREAEASPTGNTVSLEEEMMKVAATQAQYQAASNLYAKAVGMMRTALDKSGA